MPSFTTKAFSNWRTCFFGFDLIIIGAFDIFGQGFLSPEILKSDQ